jgi:hypothetical protein
VGDPADDLGAGPEACAGNGAGSSVEAESGAESGAGPAAGSAAAGGASGWAKTTPISAAAIVAATATSPVVDRIRLRVSATGGGGGVPG